MRLIWMNVGNGDIYGGITHIEKVSAKLEGRALAEGAGFVELVIK
jgi:hypothetical protein